MKVKAKKNNIKKAFLLWLLVSAAKNHSYFVCGNGECWKLDFEFHDRRIEKKKYNG